MDISVGGCCLGESRDARLALRSWALVATRDLDTEQVLPLHTSTHQATLVVAEAATFYCVQVLHVQAVHFKQYCLKWNAVPDGIAVPGSRTVEYRRRVLMGFSAFFSLWQWRNQGVR